MRRDERRDAFLASKGFRVLRFNNHEVMTNRQGVLETIAAAIAAAPSRRAVGEAG
jgi:very-short-patch-repair endonuclease